MALDARRVSLRTKLVGLVAVLFTGVAIFLATFFPARMAALSRTWAERRAVGVAAVLSSAVAPGFEFDDATNVKGLLEGLSTAPGVVYAAVRRADGSTFAAWRPEHMTDLGVQAGPEPKLVTRGELLHVVTHVPVRVGTPGTLVVGLSLAELEQERRDSRWLVAAASTTIFFIGIVVAFFVGSYFARPIRRMTDVALRVAGGDLTEPELDTKSQDEVGQMAEAFERMLRSQREMVARIAETSEQLAKAAAAIYASAKQHDAASQRQSASVEEVSRTMESLLASAGHIAESARGVLSIAERTRETNELTTNKIVELNSHAGRIGEILEVIRDIADRSDLLALNASIEASRAGEAGRSFSLVAAEMRRLAERVTASVTDIKALVGDVRGSGAATVMATEEARRLAESTTASARQITGVTDEQRTGTEQVSKSMREITTVLAESVSATHQTMALAEELKRQADRLAEAVGTFRLDRP